MALGADRLDAAQTPPPAKKAPPRKPPATVAIVGAGLGGLCAALTLHDAGVPATVYEAAGQVGGRVHSNATGYWRDGQISEWCGELINTDHQTILRLARRFGLRTVDLHAAQAPGSEDAFHVLGALYPVADADREFQAVYPLLRRDLAAAGDETTHKTRTPAGIALDRMSIREWIEARVPGGASSRLGRLLDVGVRARVRRADDRPVGAQPRVPPRGAAARGAPVPHRHVRRALPDRGRQRRAAAGHRGGPAEGRGAASDAAPGARARDAMAA